jgi:hypothetical protein
MDGWMDGWVGGWMDGWMDGRTDRQTDRSRDRSTHKHAGSLADREIDNCFEIDSVRFNPAYICLLNPHISEN